MSYVNLTPSETVGISGVTDKYRGNDTLSLGRKTDSYDPKMSGALLSTRNFSVKFNKVDWPTFVNGPGYIARKNSISFPLTGSNIKSEKAGELPVVCYSWELIRWIENIRLSNDGKIQKREPQMTIQTDVFTKGLGVHCKGISTRGKWSKKNRETTKMFKK